jgi:hypothetical protein
MSISFFIGFYPRDDDGLIVEEDSAAAHEEVNALNAALASNDLPNYAEPPTVDSPYDRRQRFGRSRVDHTGSQSLKDLAVIAPVRRQLYLLQSADLVAFLPDEFDARPECALAGVSAVVGSIPKLQSELKALAEKIGIPMTAGNIDENTATKISDEKKLGTEKNLGLDLADVANARTNWLLLFEGARLAKERGVALVLRS